MYKERNKTRDTGGGSPKSATPTMWRMISLILMFLMLAGSLAAIGSLLFKNTGVLDEAGSGGANVETTAIGGAGTEANPFLINSLDDLKTMRDAVNAGSSITGATQGTATGGTAAARTAHYKLTADIDYGGVATGSWTPIGDYATGTAKIFSGTFDGNKHVIKNIYINTTASYQGIFGYTNDAIIENLGLLDGSATIGSYSAGIVGYSNAGRVKNCFNKVNMTLGFYSGGVIGYAITTKIEECFNLGNLIFNIAASSQYCVGGVVGHTTGITTNCFNAGKVTKSVATEVFVGGVVGSSSVTTTSNLYNTGTITSTLTGTHGHAAGVLGWGFSTGTVTGSYNASTMTNVGAAERGLISNRTANINGCFGNGTIASGIPICEEGYANTDSGILTTEQMTGINPRSYMSKLGTFGTIGDGGDSTWVITPGGYPQLRCFAESDWLAVRKYSEASVNPAGFTDPGYIRNENPTVNATTSLTVPSIGNGTLKSH